MIDRSCVCPCVGGDRPRTLRCRLFGCDWTFARVCCWLTIECRRCGSGSEYRLNARDACPAQLQVRMVADTRQFEAAFARLKPEGTKPPRSKFCYIGAPAVFALELAIRPVCEAFSVYTGRKASSEFPGGCYVVGSALERADWRDVDVRVILDDAAFAREFPNAGQHWEHDAKWLLLTASISDRLSKQTDLPIDFQFQPQTLANKQHGGRRNAIGLTFTGA